MKSLISGFIAAILFGIGLGVSGMTQPTKVLGFLDITGDWDLTLLFVMIGAILTHGVSYQLITKRSSPFLDTKFYLPTKHHIDRPLIIGSVLFGIGWGLGGFCPGPAIVTAVSGKTEILVFVGFMILGMFAHRRTQRHG